jgi:sulfite reductase (NADPH) flavoprotein alpha-component
VAGGGISVLVERHAESLLEALYAGDDGPVFYVCGPAAFAAAAIAALEVLAERGGAAGEGRGLVRRMVARGRLQQDVFTSPLASGRDEPRFDASEVAFHSDETKGAWTIIDGGVYDLTEFAHLHPGGRAILLEVAGRDGTLDYRRIEHHLEPEIEAMLPMYRIGAIRRIDFGVRGALVVGPDGLHYAQLGDLFRAWVRFLHLVVEVDNAVRHDFSVLDAVTVQGDDPDEPTLLKAQLLLDTHRRFFAVYLPPLLGGDLTELWQISAGFCAPETDVRALERELEKVTAEPSAATAESGSADASTALDGLGALPEAQRLEALARITTLRGALEEADLGFLAGLKSAVAHGVRCAERWDRETPERAAVDLMSTLAGVPGLVSDLQQHIADAFEGHARGAGPGQSGFRPPPL